MPPGQGHGIDLARRYPGNGENLGNRRQRHAAVAFAAAEPFLLNRRPQVVIVEKRGSTVLTGGVERQNDHNFVPTAGTGGGKVTKPRTQRQRRDATTSSRPRTAQP